MTVSGEKIASLPGLKKGNRVRVIFRDTCCPDDVSRLIDMESRNFIKFPENSDSRDNIKAVYLSKNGWGQAPRSFIFDVVDFTSPSSGEKFRSLGNRLERIDLFD
jgi:hypothetical protein